MRWEPLEGFEGGWGENLTHKSEGVPLVAGLRVDQMGARGETGRTREETV